MTIAVDIGTTHVKAAAFDQAGNVLSSAIRSNETLSPKPGWNEQNPNKLLQNVLSVTAEVCQNAPIASYNLIFSAALHGLMAVDQNGNPLTNIWLWSDTRAVEEARDLREKGGVALYQRSGVPIHPMSPLLKLIWLRKHLPDVFSAAHKFLGIKEYIWYKFCGAYASDLSCASATGLMHLEDCRWDEQALSQAGIQFFQLPELVSPLHTTISKPDILPGNPTLIIGAGDGPLANLGAGATEPGQACITVGTSAALRMITDKPMIDEQMRSFCYRLDETRFVAGGASNNGGNVLEWLRNSVFRSALPIDQFLEQAADIPSGAEGLQFMPYLFGERAPVWDASATACFSGICAHHTQAHFVRAAMEGVLWNLKAVAEILEEKTPLKTIFVSGSIIYNPLWIKILKEIFKQEIIVPTNTADASVLGAYLLATRSFSS